MPRLFLKKLKALLAWRIKTPENADSYVEKP